MTLRVRGHLHMFEGGYLEGEYLLIFCVKAVFCNHLS